LLAALSKTSPEAVREVLGRGATVYIREVETPIDAANWRRCLERADLEVSVATQPVRKPGVLATMSLALILGGLLAMSTSTLLALASAAAGLMLALKAGQDRRWYAPAPPEAVEPLRHLRPLYRTVAGLELPKALLHDLLDDLAALATRLEALESSRHSLSDPSGAKGTELEETIAQCERALRDFEHVLVGFNTAATVAEAEAALIRLVQRVHFAKSSDSSGE
jgi:hypothetical protein